MPVVCINFFKNYVKVH